MVRLLKEQDVNIEVKHEGILEVPEGKSVDDLPMSHFEKLVKKKGLSKITKALNNLQVWNKNDNKKLSKWAGDMIDKLNKKYGKKESISRRRFNEEWNGRKHIEQRLMKYIPKRLQPYVVWLDYEPSSHVYFLTFEKDGVEYSPDPADDVSELAYNARQYTDELLGRTKNPKKPEKKESVEIPIGWKERTITVDDDEQEAAVEEILTYAKRDNDKIEWDVDYNGGMFGGDRVFYIYSDGDTFSEVQYTVKQMKDDALYGRGAY